MKALDLPRAARDAVPVKWVAALLVVLACGGTPPLQSHGRMHTQAKMPTPTLGVEDEYKGELKTAKLRVYADDEHRDQNPKWQETFSGMLHHANEILAAQFGVKLVAEYKIWSYRRAGESLEAELVALAALDPGADAFAVVALTSAQTLVSTTFDHIGIATTPGKHVVLRGYSDREERAAIDKEIDEAQKASKSKKPPKPRPQMQRQPRGMRPSPPTSATPRPLGPKQRAWVAQTRRRHKVVSLFLHQLAHTLGVQHRDEPGSVMSAQYSPRLAGFDETSRGALQRAIDARLGRATPDAPPVETKHPTLVIIVDETGNRIVGGNSVDDATLDGLLKLHFTDDKDTEVLIKTRDKAPQNVVLAIVQHAKAAGLQKVSIARE